MGEDGTINYQNLVYQEKRANTAYPPIYQDITNKLQMPMQSLASLGENEEQVIKSGLNIKLICFENMTPQKTIKAKLDFHRETLGTSPAIPVKTSDAEDVNWEILYEIDIKDESIIDSLVCHPLVFTILAEDLPELHEFDEKEQVEGGKNLKNRKSSKSRSKETSMGSISKKSTKSKRSRSKSPSWKGSVKSSLSQNILGVANLDILPLLLGEVQIGISLLIHPVNEELGSLAVAWTNLPRMQVSVTSVGDITFHFTDKIANVMLFTLESIHNITPQFTENLQIGTIFPRGQEFDIITFTRGSLVTDNMKWISRRKKWIGLSDLKGQGALSHYMMCENIAELHSTMAYQVTENMLQSIPRLQWNQICRKSLNNESEQILKDKLITQRCWPVEVLLSRTSAKDKDFEKGKGDRRIPKESVGNDHFITFLDPTRLLYPGETTCRLACQLFTYTDTATLQRFGTEIPMFRPRDLSVPKSPKPVSKKERSRATTPKKKSVVKLEKEMPLEELLPVPEPVFNEDGDPVFIVVQIELLRPLLNKKESEEVLDSIEEIVSHKCEPTFEEQAFINATESFGNCIADLVSVANNEYQQFFNINEKMSSEKSCKNYMMHLHMTGAHARMKESMRETIEDYIQNVLGVQLPLDVTKQDNQETMAEVYRSLIAKMCSIVNCVDPIADELDSLVTCEKLLFYATEAYEEGMPEKAKEYLLQRLDTSSKADPIFWLDYARYLVKKLEFEKAEECAREAIALDYKCIDALLFHGLLSWLTEDIEVAELLLSAAVSMDPHSMEAWAILYIFHKQINKQLEANVELINAKKCFEKKFEPKKGIRGAALLTWCPALADSDRIFLHTAIHMMRLSFPELAESALSYDLLRHGRSVPFLYFLAACQYLQGCYEQSLHHIEEALTISWQEFRLWTLKGHNHYKLGQMCEAKQAYKFVFDSPTAPATSHMLNLRAGNILLGEGNLQGARECFMTICNLSPSPLSWLGLGITSFTDDEVREAELALNEANLLDGRHGRVWGYLALVNLMLARPAVSARCMGQAIRYGLDDPVLLEKLHVLGQFSESSFI